MRAANDDLYRKNMPRLNFTNCSQGINFKKMGHFAIGESFEQLIKTFQLFGVYALRRVGEIKHQSLTLHIGGCHGERVDGDNGVGAEDDQLIGEQINEQNLRVDLQGAREPVVQLLLARVDANFVLRGGLKSDDKGSISPTRRKV